MSLSVIIASSSGYIFKYSNKALSETLANSEGLLIRDSQLSLGHPSFVAINSIFNYFQAEARMRYWLTMMLCVGGVRARDMASLGFFFRVLREHLIVCSVGSC